MKASKRLCTLIAIVLIACGSEKEWERKASSLTLEAVPLPPVAGMPLALDVRAENVGPVSVFQGDELIASFVNVPLDGKRRFTVQARSNQIPRAEAVGYDYRTLEAEARLGSGGAPMMMPTAGSGGASAGSGGASAGTGGTGGAGEVDDCPGVVEVTDECSMSGSKPVKLRVSNAATVILELNRRSIAPDGMCVDQLLELIQPRTVVEVDLFEGDVLHIAKDGKAITYRRPRLPAVDVCTIVIRD